MPGKTVLVVGAGAIGAFYASRLTHVAQVSCICRSNYASVSKHGFKMRTRTFGDYEFHPTHTFSCPADCEKTGIKWDYIIVATKALPDVSDDTRLITRLVYPGHSSIVLIQNGVGIESPYRRAFPFNPILSAVTISSCAQPEPGTIVQNRWTRISVGPFSGDDDLDASSRASTDNISERDSKATATVSDFVSMLQAGGIKDAEVFDEQGLQLVRWHKIAINSAMNPSSVLTLAGNRDMSLDPEMRVHLKAVMEEVLEAAPRILGKPFSNKMASADQVLASTEQSGDSRPSMLADWEQSNPMEVEVILGNPIRIARGKGIEMPRTQTLYALVKLKQEQRDSQKRSKL